MPVGAAVAVVGAGTAIYGNEENKKAQKKQKKGLQSIVDQYEGQQLGNLEQGLGEQERLTKQANREELEGGEDAIKRYESVGTQAIEDQSEKALSGITAGASSRGLMGSSVQGNARIGVGRAASRSYMSLGETISSMRQNLATRKAAGTMRLGQLKAYRAQARNSILGNSMNTLAGFQASQQVVSQPPALGGLGMLAGYASGGGFNKPPAAPNAYDQFDLSSTGILDTI